MNRMKTSVLLIAAGIGFFLGCKSTRNVSAEYSAPSTRGLPVTVASCERVARDSTRVEMKLVYYFSNNKIAKIGVQKAMNGRISEEFILNQDLKRVKADRMDLGGGRKANGWMISSGEGAHAVVYLDGQGALQEFESEPGFLYEESCFFHREMIMALTIGPGEKAWPIVAASCQLGGLDNKEMKVVFKFIDNEISLIEVQNLNGGKVTNIVNVTAPIRRVKKDDRTRVNGVPSMGWTLTSQGRAAVHLFVNDQKAIGEVESGGNMSRMFEKGCEMNPDLISALEVAEMESIR